MLSGLITICSRAFAGFLINSIAAATNSGSSSEYSMFEYSKIVSGEKWRAIISPFICIKLDANTANCSCSDWILTEPNLAFILDWPTPSYWLLSEPCITSVMPVICCNKPIVWSRISVNLSSATIISCSGNHEIASVRPPFSPKSAQFDTGISVLSLLSFNIWPISADCWLYTPTTLTASVIVAMRVCNLSTSLYKSWAITKSGTGSYSFVVTLAIKKGGQGQKLDSCSGSGFSSSCLS